MGLLSGGYGGGYLEGVGRLCGGLARLPGGYEWLTDEGVWRVWGRGCLEGVWKLFEGCGEALQRVYGGCLDGVGRLSGGCGESAWMMLGGCLESVGRFLEGMGRLSGECGEDF